ncbi:MAG: C1 family peptidase, partial [Enterococcus sp.]
MSKIKNERTKAFREAFEKNSKQVALQRGVVKNGIRTSAENIQAQIENTPVFSIDLATGKVANQKQSGRCWMFAALNTFRHKLLTSFQLKDFELSQNYTFFWDKYEKANYFYENILNTAE